MTRTPHRDETRPQSWWTTLPGILTGLAALITAIGGLMIAYHQVTNRSAPSIPDASTAARSAGSTSNVVSSAAVPSVASSSNTPAQGLASAATVEIATPTMSEVKLDAGETNIRILKVELQPYNAENRALKFTVRYSNNGRYPANFWSSSYRLLVDDVPRAPTNSLNEVVPNNSAKVGEVIFEIPLTVTQVILQVSSGPEKTQIPVPLKPVGH
jgi:hypothetical protein